MLTTDREKAICEKYSAYDKNNRVHCDEFHLLKEILLNMTSGAKRIVIIIDTLANGNMMIKSKKKRHSVYG